jgi:Family of unknown function (DUF6101)
MYAGIVRRSTPAPSRPGHDPTGSTDLRRQADIRGITRAWASREQRLDPFALPLSFEVADVAADGRIRFVELTRERVVLRRAVRGMRMAVNLPVSSYLGVALRVEPLKGDAESAVALVLEHRDPSLSLPLYQAEEGTEVVAEWQSWGRMLNLPLLVAEPDGGLREPFKRMGALRIEKAGARRRRRSTLKARRPSIFLRRRPGRLLAGMAIHRGEREIIARN